MKELPDFISAQQGNASIWLAPDMARPSMFTLMANPDCLFEQPGCVIVKDQRKIKVARVTLPLDGGETTVYVKRYNAFSLRYRLQSVFVRSGAAKSLRGSAILSAIGVPTARPIAAIEQRRGGILIKSFFVSEEINGGKTLDAYWREHLAGRTQHEEARRRRRFLKALARLFSALHSHKVYHGDLKDANIIVAPSAGSRGDSFFLLDLEGVRVYRRLSRRRRIKNLVQLNRTLGKYVKQSERWYFLNSYLSAEAIDRAGRKRWAEEVLKQSARVDRIKHSTRALCSF